MSEAVERSGSLGLVWMIDGAGLPFCGCMCVIYLYIVFIL